MLGLLRTSPARSSAEPPKVTCYAFFMFWLLGCCTKGLPCRVFRYNPLTDNVRSQAFLTTLLHQHIGRAISPSRGWRGQAPRQPGQIRKEAAVTSPVWVVVNLSPQALSTKCYRRDPSVVFVKCDKRANIPTLQPLRCKRIATPYVACIKTHIEPTRPLSRRAMRKGMRIGHAPCLSLQMVVTDHPRCI